MNTRVSSKTIVRGSENPGPTYWEGKAPPSSVLGIGAGVPSGVFGPLSIVAFVAGTYAIHDSNILNQITPTTINPVNLAGSVLVPISWGMHVAAWIQKQNGK
jgi:hypothetical protein